MSRTMTIARCAMTAAKLVGSALVVASAVASCSDDPDSIEGGWSTTSTYPLDDAGASYTESRFWDFGSEKKFRFWVRRGSVTTCSQGTYEVVGSTLKTTTGSNTGGSGVPLSRPFSVSKEELVITDNEGTRTYRRGGLPDGLTCP